MNGSTLKTASINFAGAEPKRQMTLMDKVAEAQGLANSLNGCLQRIRTALFGSAPVNPGADKCTEDCAETRLDELIADLNELLSTASFVADRIRD